MTMTTILGAGGQSEMSLPRSWWQQKLSETLKQWTHARLPQIRNLHF